MMLRRRIYIRRRALTLIEVLAALCLGGLVTGAATNVAVQSVALRRSVERELDQRWQRQRVFDQFRRDIEGGLWWLSEEVEIATFPTEGDGLLKILTLADAARPDSLFIERVPADVAYFLEPSNTVAGAKQLIREMRDLTDRNESKHRSLLADGLASAVVESIQRQNGNAERGTHPENADLQAAAIRLTCTWREESRRPVRTTVRIPNVFQNE